MFESLMGESAASYITHAWFSRIIWTLASACVFALHPKRDRIVRRVCSTSGAASRVLLSRARPAQRCTAPLGLLDYLPAEVLPAPRIGYRCVGGCGRRDSAGHCRACSAAPAPRNRQVLPDLPVCPCPCPYG